MNRNGSEHKLGHTSTRMEANTHGHKFEQEWKQTHTGTSMNKNGSEHTLARMEVNTHIHTL